MMPAQIVPTAVAVGTNTRTQPNYLDNQFVPGQVRDIVIHCDPKAACSSDSSEPIGKEVESVERFVIARGAPRSDGGTSCGSRSIAQRRIGAACATPAIAPMPSALGAPLIPPAKRGGRPR